MKRTTTLRFLVLLLFLLTITASFAQPNCAQDFKGIPFCAPPGGSAVSTVTGVVICAVGKCVIDNQGYPKCSNVANGGATKDYRGNVFCVGRCVSPTKEQCLEMNR